MYSVRSLTDIKDVKFGNSSFSGCSVFDLVDASHETENGSRYLHEFVASIACVLRLLGKPKDHTKSNYAVTAKCCMA